MEVVENEGQRRTRLHRHHEEADRAVGLNRVATCESRCQLGAEFRLALTRGGDEIAQECVRVAIVLVQAVPADTIRGGLREIEEEGCLAVARRRTYQRDPPLVRSRERFDQQSYGGQPLLSVDDK